MAGQVRSARITLTLWVVVCVCLCLACAREQDDPSDTANLDSQQDGQSSAVHRQATTIHKKHTPKPLRTTDNVMDEPEDADNRSGSSSSSIKARPEWQGSSSSSQSSSSTSGGGPVREAASNTSSQGSGGGGAPATAQELRSATSLAGNLLLLLISVVIAGSLFVMLLCFIHKWKENMGTARYPRVVYSMLRQSEDEPEDVLGEILINIGLAAPEDARPLTPSSSETSDSPEASDHEVNINDLDGSKFTTIPLRSDEAAKRLMAPEPEESDEELLQ